MSSDREQVLEMLSDWQYAKPWARVDPKTLRIASAEPVGPTQIVLRSVLQTRLIRYEFKAAKRPIFAAQEPDPWATDVTFPKEAEVGAEKRIKLSTEVHLHCAACTGEGRVECPDCRGSGRAPLVKRDCDTCDGKTRVTCKTCDGGGGVRGLPTVIARLDAHEEIRTLGTEALPIEIVFALGESTAAGTTIHRQEATQITEVRVMPTGYRDGQSIAPQVIETARTLVSQPGIPENARVQHQTLELKRTTLFEVRLEDGAHFFVWDSPPKVHPHRPLSTWLGRLFAR